MESTGTSPARPTTPHSSELFGPDYFERGPETGMSLYENYRWLPEQTIPFAATLCEQLGICEGHRVLDFGCAKGYLVHALRLLHRDAWGADISAYALDCAPPPVREFLFHGNAWRNLPYIDMVLAKDVLEHMGRRELGTFLEAARKQSQRLWVCVPLGEHQQYVIPDMEKDVTHKVREGLAWWRKTIRSHGWKVEWGRHSMPHVKEHWAHYKKGHGFFLCV